MMVSHRVLRCVAFVLMWPRASASLPVVAPRSTPIQHKMLWGDWGWCWGEPEAHMVAEGLKQILATEDMDKFRP